MGVLWQFSACSGIVRPSRCVAVLDEGNSALERVIRPTKGQGSKRSMMFVSMDLVRMDNRDNLDHWNKLRKSSRDEEATVPRDQAWTRWLAGR